MKALKLLCLFMAIARINCLLQDWTYELMDIVTKAENPDKINLQLEVERIGRGDFAISGLFTVGEEMTDELLVEVTLERSATGSSDYKVQPFKVPKDTITKIFNGVYKKFIMESLKKCAPDAPQFTTFKAPLKVTNAKLDKCVISTELLPTHMQDGFYKLVITMSGQAALRTEIYLKIEQKI